MPLVFEQVSFSYEAGHEVLHGLDFALEDGSMTGIVGAMGSGKSTLAQLMNALLVPTSGRVLLDGLDTAQRKNRRIVRSKVGLVFQYPETQFFAATVADELAFGLHNLRFETAQIHQRCSDALAKVGLSYEELAQENPFALSGGQQRRVALASTLVMQPQVLVLDEPAAGIDRAGIQALHACLAQLNSEGVSVVLISHSMEEVASLCSNVLVVSHGTKRLFDAPERVFAPEHEQELHDMGLCVPQATRFALKLAQGGFDLPDTVVSFEQLVDAVAGALEGDV